MTPKEKAIELIDRYNVLQTFIEYFDHEHAKECALIAVDEILEIVIVYDDISKDYEYWKQVKQEIGKL